MITVVNLTSSLTVENSPIAATTAYMLDCTNGDITLTLQSPAPAAFHGCRIVVMKTDTTLNYANIVISDGTLLNDGNYYRYRLDDEDIPFILTCVNGRWFYILNYYWIGY